MATHEIVDYYEVLQVSSNAEPETIHRVYRLLAQQLHPDNRDTGDTARFQQLTEAYQVLGDPARRAQYDVAHEQLRRQRWRLVSSGADSENDFATEQRLRLTVLEILYTRRRLEAGDPGLSPLDLETLTGVPREQLEFTVWYLVQKKCVTRSDSSKLVVTAEGVDLLENSYRESQTRRLTAAR